MGLIKRSSEYAYSEGAKGLHAAETSNIHASTSGIGTRLRAIVVIVDDFLALKTVLEIKRCLVLSTS